MMRADDSTLRPLVQRLTLEEKVTLLTGKDSWSLPAIPHIGLRSIVMSDGPAGVRGTAWDERDPSVSFPSPTALAATWDRATVRMVGDALGTEARRKHVDVVLAPTINLQRTPYGGRHFEAFSEDPVLTADLATEYVQGIQSHGVGATVKHYVANDSETDRFTVDVQVDERTLRELYLQAFEGPVVNGSAWLVMSAYNSVNGARATENTLLTTPLQDEWAFDGVVVSDWTAVRSIEAARHPQDVVMPGPDGAWGENLLRAVQSGEVGIEDVDRKVLRILRLAARVGALESVDASDASTTPVSRSPLEVTRLASGDGMVLLTNDGLLPLRKPKQIALIGEGARFARIQGGGSATVMPTEVVSPLDGVRAHWPDAKVTWSHGAVVQQGIAPLPAGAFTTPDGDPGMLVRYLDASGSERGSEQRDTSWLVWFDGSSLASKAKVVEFSFTYTPEAAADAVPFGVAGVADVDVVADGVLIGSLAIRTKPGDDPATVVLNPPFTTLDVPLAGPSVDLVVRFRPVAGEMPDALALRVGVPPATTPAEALIAEAVSAAREADVAVVVVGTSNEVESEGFDRTFLRLPGVQDELVRAVAAVNPRTIVVVNSGGPVQLPWRAIVGAVLVTWFPGQEFGHALADVLSGDVEPGGRLPFTWPEDEADVPVSQVRPVNGVLRYAEGIHIGYRAWARESRRPAFWFGHGLGYTSWDVSDFVVADPREEVGVVGSVTVQNTGTRRGKAVLQVYIERIGPSAVDRPVRWLATFQTVRLDAGGLTRVAVTVPARRFMHWDGDWKAEPGSYRLIASLDGVDQTGAEAVVVLTPDPVLVADR